MNDTTLTVGARLLFALAGCGIVGLFGAPPWAVAAVFVIVFIGG